MEVKYLDNGVNKGWYIVDEYGIVFHGETKEDCEYELHDLEDSAFTAHCRVLD